MRSTSVMSTPKPTIIYTPRAALLAYLNYNVSARHRQKLTRYAKVVSRSHDTNGASD
jgi:hypothetical protein